MNRPVRSKHGLSFPSGRRFGSSCLSSCLSVWLFVCLLICHFRNRDVWWFALSGAYIIWRAPLLFIRHTALYKTRGHWIMHLGGQLPKKAFVSKLYYSYCFSGHTVGDGFRVTTRFPSIWFFLGLRLLRGMLLWRIWTVLLYRLDCSLPLFLFVFCGVGLSRVGPPLLIAADFFLSFYLGFIFESWSTVAIEAPENSGEAMTLLLGGQYPFVVNCRIALGIQSVLFRYRISAKEFDGLGREGLFAVMVFRLADPGGGAGEHAVFQGSVAPIFPEAVRCLRMTGCFKHVLADCPLDAVAPPPPPPPPPLERAATKCVYSAPSLRRNSCRLRFRVLRFASLLVFLGRGLCPGFWLWARFVSGVLALGAVCVLACLWARFVSWLAFGRGLRPGRL